MLNPGIESSLDDILDNQFQAWENRFDVKIKSSDLASRFRNIIMAAYEATGRTVVILIDEYDNPIIETRHDPERSESHRLLLKSIYVNIKDLDRYIRFTMLTGVSRFSKMTIFSGLNNLKDISLNKTYATICGITETELVDNFKHGIEKLAAHNGTDAEGAIRLLKANYDGYHFTKNCPDIYNSFSLLWALDEGGIGSYWFRSGTPEFLVRQIKEGNRFLP